MKVLLFIYLLVFSNYFNFTLPPCIEGLEVVCKEQADGTEKFYFKVIWKNDEICYPNEYDITIGYKNETGQIIILKTNTIPFGSSSLFDLNVPVGVEFVYSTSSSNNINFNDFNTRIKFIIDPDNCALMELTGDNSCCPNEQNLIDKKLNGTNLLNGCFLNEGTLLDEFVNPNQFLNVTNQNEEAVLELFSIKDYNQCGNENSSRDVDFKIFNGATDGTSMCLASINTGELNLGEEYLFCFKVKNIPQCHFDILPSIKVWKGGDVLLNNEVIETTGDVCDWNSYSINFTVESSQEFIGVELLSSHEGDGNDIAIGGFEIIEIKDRAIGINNRNMSSTSSETYTLQSVINIPITEAKKCNYVWSVCEIKPDRDTFTIVPNTSMLGNNSTGWQLANTFKGYNNEDDGSGKFKKGRYYRIGLLLFDCPCYKKSFTYTDYFVPKSNINMKSVQPQKSSKMNKGFKAYFFKQALDKGFIKSTN